MQEANSNQRSLNYKSQIKWAFVYKLLAMIASFLTIPLMINYLGHEKFGIWATMLAVISWIMFFDLGVGNGLRNKVAEALAKGKKDEATDLITSGYKLIGLFALFIWLLFIGVSFITPWQSIFNTVLIPEVTLRLTVQIAATFIFLNFWLGLIGAILGAVQKQSLVVMGQCISNISALIFVYLLTKTTEASLPSLAFVYGVSLVGANIFLSYLFYKQFPELKPTKILDNKSWTELLSISSQFFIIQLTMLLIFTTDKILITQIFGPAYVTQYEVIFKLFSVITSVHILIAAPVWAACTEAYAKGDFLWIKNMLHKQELIFCIVILAVVVLCFTAKFIVSIWIGPEMKVEMPLVFAMGLFVLISNWSNLLAMFINATGKIGPQLYSTIVAMLTNIPLAILFTKILGLGLQGVVLATCVSLSMVAVVLPIQINKIIRDGLNLEVRRVA